MIRVRSGVHRQGNVRMSSELRARRGKSAPYRPDVDDEDFDRFPEDPCSRVLDFQRVPSSAPADPGPVKRPRPSSSSSSSSSTAALRRRSRASSRGSGEHSSSSSSRIKMAELLAIKRELTVIKVQIDGLLDYVDYVDYVDQMVRQRKDGSDGPHSVRDPSLSPHRASVCSLESPEPGEWV
ncbi:uncharacterized protein V6R79_003822 [Siganus canaliculatus]